MMDVNEETQLERLTWAVYDKVLLPGDIPLMSGPHSLDRILSGVYRLIYRGKWDSKHCPASTICSANAEQALRKARQPGTASVKSTVQVAPRAASLYQGKKHGSLP